MAFFGGFRLGTAVGREAGEVDAGRMLPLIWRGNFMLGSAGVAKLVYAPDSKSGEVHSSCRFESDLRHQPANFLD